MRTSLYPFSLISPLGELILMPGSNTIVRGNIYEEVGGVPHISGGEDMALSTKIMNTGKEIVYNQDLEVSVSSRISDRTHKQHGMGQSVKRISEEENFADMKIPSLEAQELYHRIILYAQRAHSDSKGDVSQWRKYFASNIMQEYPNISGEDITLLQEAYIQGVNIKNVDDNPLFEFEARNLIGKVFPLKKMEEVFKDSIAYIMQQSHIDMMFFEEAVEESGEVVPNLLLHIFLKLIPIDNAFLSFNGMLSSIDSSPEASSLQLSLGQYFRLFAFSFYHMNLYTHSLCNKPNDSIDRIQFSKKFGKRIDLYHQKLREIAHSKLAEFEKAMNAFLVHKQGIDSFYKEHF